MSKMKRYTKVRAMPYNATTGAGITGVAILGAAGYAAFTVLGFAGCVLAAGTACLYYPTPKVVAPSHVRKPYRWWEVTSLGLVFAGAVYLYNINEVHDNYAAKHVVAQQHPAPVNAEPQGMGWTGRETMHIIVPKTRAPQKPDLLESIW